MLDPIVVDSLPELASGPDGRWDLGAEPLLAAPDRLLAAAAVVLHKSVPVRWPLVLRPEQPATPSSRWVLDLPVPIDHAWLRARAVLPDRLELGHEGGRAYVGDGFDVVVSAHTPGDASWVRAGWRQGEDYSGPVPPPRVGLLGPLLGRS